MHLVDENDEKEDAWAAFLAQVDEQGVAREDIKGFMLAVRDCCLAKGEGSPAPVTGVPLILSESTSTKSLLDQISVDLRHHLGIDSARQKLSKASARISYVR